jgi:hypothetical protein
MSWLQVFIGADSREPRAAEVAMGTLRQAGAMGSLLVDQVLRQRGLLWRSVDRRGAAYDLTSGANMSTEFAISRFLTPILATGKWALFADADVIFRPNCLRELVEVADERFAVQVVKHEYQPSRTVKMDRQPQQPYARKNWSSVMLFNCEHAANKRLTLHDINTRPGLYLHQFGWLADDEIGELPAGFNWLVGEQPMPNPCHIVHMTNGGPFTPGWPGAEHDALWLDAEAGLQCEPWRYGP